MASTRNKNLKSDYCLEQKRYTESLTYNFYQFSPYGQAYSPAIPSIGYTPSHINPSALSNNHVDIESSLFGINSTNLVEPAKPVIPELNKLPMIDFFNRMAVIMPQPLYMDTNQRPLPS